MTRRDLLLGIGSLGGAGALLVGCRSSSSSGRPEPRQAASVAPAKAPPGATAPARPPIDTLRGGGQLQTATFALG